MKINIYKTWIIISLVILAAGILLFVSDKKDITAFLYGAGITFINVILLGRSVSALLTHTRKQFTYVFLLVLKYAFLLTAVYAAIVIIKLNPVPFILGITILPLSIIIMALLLMLRRTEQ